MSAIVVCPLSRLAETVAAYRASHIVTLVNDGTLFARPPVVEAVNLYDNIRRLKLDVQQIAPIHGRWVTINDLRAAIGRPSIN